MDDTGRYGEALASYPGMRHGARAPRWHTRNSSENSDRQVATGDRGKPDSPSQRARAKSVSCIRDAITGIRAMLRYLKPAVKLFQDREHLVCQGCEGCLVGFGANSENNVSNNACRQNVNSNELPQPSFYEVPCNSCVFEPRDDQANPAYRGALSWMRKRGSCRPNVEMPGSDALPPSRNTLKLRTTRNTCLPRKAKRDSRRIMLRSTYPGYERSVAYVPFSGDERVLRVPTSFPSAHGNRAS